MFSFLAYLSSKINFYLLKFVFVKIMLTLLLAMCSIT